MNEKPVKVRKDKQRRNIEKSNSEDCVGQN